MKSTVSTQRDNATAMPKIKAMQNIDMQAIKGGRQNTVIDDIVLMKK
jgi:hypothetical protein